MTREEARDLMPAEMAAAFDKGRQAAQAGDHKYISNPYGGLAYEVGTPAYPATVPAQFREHTGWLRAEWFWGYEDVT